MKKIFNYLRQLLVGRLGRKHYFMGFLIAILSLIPTMLLIIGLVEINAPYAVIVILPGIAIFICVAFKLSLDIRRLQDTGHSGIWILLILLPYIRWVLLLYLLLWKGTNQANKYGDISKKSFIEDVLSLGFWKTA